MFHSPVRHKKHHKKNLLSVAVTSLLITQSMHVQAADANQAKNVVDLGETVIRGHLHEHKHVYSEDITQQDNHSLGALLSDNMGINADTFGNVATRPIIRGQVGERVTILSDGVTQTDASHMSPDHAIAINTLAADDIEILRGPQALAYGANATTGVIDVRDKLIVTEQPADPLSGNIGLQGSSVDNGGLVYANTLFAPNENWVFSFSGKRSNRSDYDIPHYLKAHDEHHEEHDEDHEDEHEEHHDEHEGESAKKVANSFSQEDSVGLGINWLGSNMSIGLSYNEEEKTYGLPGHAHNDCHVDTEADGSLELHCEEHDHGDEHEDAEGEDHHDEEHGHEAHGDAPYVVMDTKSYALAAQFKPAGFFKQLDAKVKYTDYQHDEYDEGEVGTTFTNKGINSRFSAKHTPMLNGKLFGEVGLQYDNTEFAAVGEEAYVPETDTRLVALYVNERYQPSKQWHVDLAGRVEKKQLDTAENDSKDFTGVSLATEGVWHAANDVRYGVMLSHSQRLPSAVELFADGPHIATNTIERGNADLDAEKTTGIELSASKRKGNWQFDSSLFYNHVADYIYAKTLAQEDAIRLVKYSQQDASLYGGELSASYTFNPRITLVGYGDIVRGEFDQAEDGNKNIPRMPAARMGVKMINDFGNGWETEVDAYHRFRQRDYAAFEENTRTYDMVNAKVRYTTDSEPSMSVYINANNLLNEEAYNHSSFIKEAAPLPGRNISTGIEFKF